MTKQDTESKTLRIALLGAGWLGLPLAQQLHHFGLAITIVSRTPEKFLETKLPYLSFESFYSQQKNFDLIISTLPASAKDAFKTLNKEIPLLATGSTAVYASNEGIITEESALISLPQTEFESYLLQQFPKLTLLRLGGLIGYNRHPGKFLSGKKNLSGKNHPTNLIHRDDIIQIVMELLKLEKIPAGVFNIVCDQHPLKEAFYTQACLDLNLEKPHFKTDDNSSNKLISNEKIKSLLHYNFLYPSPLDYLKVLKLRSAQR